VIVSHDPESASIADRVVRIRDGRVSEEWARESGGGDAIVVGRGGWLRLPEELLLRAGIRSRATARIEDGEIVVASAEASGLQPQTPDAPRLAVARPPGGVVAAVRGLQRRYGAGATAVAAIDGLDATFASGRLTVVTGPSGSGKTTLLHLLAGLDLPTAGEIEVAGARVDTLDRAGRAALRAREIGFVGQQPGLVPFLSARENVELALAIRGAEDDADALLAAVGLEERAGQRLERLSQGERARVAIARALASRPAVLLVDEPTSRLDQANAVAVAALLADVARAYDTAVICATHDHLVMEQADDELPLIAPAERIAAVV
jgi:ABC-type lipoprotein export system ATPase subunit